ncbi:MAG TPA: VWA domain-containing protein [Noviherbaspirillum sp.]|uniref:VWA domain-containing protein n=1 Tax=Noviherbaspirillum sp. TaxID=1926288 RepID=UPI002D4056D8|nr:VWA domain-containing protein [Noviherbaspirillum sp.]HYD94719.1 VWA domain-containing protein [Noviherbaspirillum sp.]
MMSALLWFSRPWWLLALLPVALAAWRCLRSRSDNTAWRRVVEPHLLPHLLTQTRQGRANAFLFLLAAALAVLALAGPAGTVALPRDATMRDSVRVLVVDLSPGAAPQLERIQHKLHALLRMLDGGETALLVYADEPYLVVPPSSDAQVVARFIPELAVDAMPAPGDRPERALRMAADLLARNQAAVQDIVWISAGSARAALPAGLNGIRLSVLQAGADEDPALRAAIGRSGGILVRMRNDDTDLMQLAEILRSGSTRPAAKGSDGTDLGYWLLLPLLPLAALQFRRGLLALLPLILCAGMLPAPAEAARLADVAAHPLFAQGRHEEAARRFADARWQAAAYYRAGRFGEAARLLEGIEEAGALYNRGNALAKLGRLDHALAAYEAALALRPGDADTVYNRDLVRRLLQRNNGGKGGAGGGGAGGGSEADVDAERLAAQWLRGVPDDPGSLLRRKLQIEHQRRRTGGMEKPWEQPW